LIRLCQHCVMTIAPGRTYAGKSSAARAAGRRAELLDAGLQVISESGVGAATVRTVLARSGVAQRYFYENFASVDDFHVAVFEQVVETAEQRALVALTSKSGGSLRERMRVIIEAMVDYAFDHPAASTVFFVQAAGSPLLGPQRQAALNRFAAWTAGHAGSMTDEFDYDAADPRVRLTAQFAIGGLVETLTAVLQGELDGDRQVLVDDLTELFVSAVNAIRRMSPRG
jgi:AcrR family transcriptional regulator